ncbi:SPFH/Band 7/PHB domain protein, partial [Candidatus Beckwithbacteria bacterium]|nr:SPFH/Band 7/PHB domain protein [Candidatus Beckwithbacteria bacterium]
MDFASMVLLFIAVIFIIAFLRSIRIVNQYQKGLVIRLGKYSSTADSGLAFLMPFIDSVILVDMREQVINVEPQKVITKDNVSVIVDAVIYYKVVDPVKAEFEIEDFDYAATTLAQTNLRNFIGDKTLDETLTARDTINTSLREILDDATNSW